MKRITMLFGFVLISLIAFGQNVHYSPLELEKLNAEREVQYMEAKQQLKEVYRDIHFPVQKDIVVDYTKGLTYPGEIQVLILTPDSDGSEAIRSALDGYAHISATSFPQANLPGLSLSDLTPYDVILTFNNNQWLSVGGVSPDLVGDLLADYIDQGGLFVENSYVMDWDAWQMGGSYVNDGYSAFEQATADFSGTFTMGTVHEPAHPIMTGVSTFGTSGSSLIQDNAVASGATRIVDWNNGQVLVAAKDQVVSFNMLTMATGALNYIGDGTTLYNNAVVWLMLNQADPSAPGEPANFTAIAGAMGVLEVTLGWNNPAETVDGNTLTDLDAVHIYRNGELIHTINNPTIGGAETYIDSDITESGVYSYAVAGENDEGEGLSATTSVFVGEDVPGAPEDVLLVADGNNGVITWNAPTEGLNGGYFDDSNLTYTVVRFPDEVEVATDIVEEAFTDTTVPGIGNYLYAVTASNDMGEGGTAESNAALLGADGYLIFEGFEDEWPPVGWTNNGWTLSTFGQPHTGDEFAYCNLAGSTLKTPVVTLPEGSAYNLEFYFRAESANFPQDFDVRISLDGGDFTNIFSVTGYDVATYEEVNLSLAEYSGSDVQIKFVGLSGEGGWAFGVLLDDVSVYMPFDNDLEGVSISGNTTPSAGVQSTYTIGVFNAGAFAQSDYTVKLMQEGDVEIDSQVGETIEPGETILYELTWTPMEEGATYIYGYVDFPEDEAPGNNQTPILNVNVQASGLVAVTIGTDEVVPVFRAPFDLWYNNSLAQTIYYPEELGGVGGLLTGVTYYNTFVNNLEDEEIRVYAGVTDKDDLSDGFIADDIFTLVYEGFMDFPAGTNSIYIPFDEPFAYGGGNLVLMTNKKMYDYNGGFNDRFFSTQTPDKPARLRHAASDGVEYDPLNPPTAGTNRDWVPNTTLFFDVAGIGSLEGVISDVEDNPLEDVYVALVGTALSTLTDENGAYNFPYLMPGTYDMELSKFGFVDKLIEGIIIEEDETTVQDATLDAVVQYVVSGTVEGNDGLLVPSAQITMTGYDEYTAETDASGQFVIENVYEGVYEVHITADGYDPYTEEGIVVDDDVDLEFTMIETIHPPFGLQVQTEGLEPGEALFTWNPTGNGDIFFEDFEEGEMPEGWDQIITNTATDGPVPATWTVNDYVSADFSPFGTYHAGLWWDFGNQDEWLISPEVSIGPSYELEFWSAVFLGSQENDHYYVKISTDGGDNWTVLWDASAQTGGWNYYDTPFVLDLDDYVGQNVHIAFNAVDGPTNDGLWYIWFIDNVSMGPEGARNTIAMNKFDRLSKGQPVVVDNAEPVQLARDGSAASIPVMIDRVDKAFIGFNVYLDDDMVAESIEENEYLFTGLEDGAYTAGVQSVYTTDTSDIIEIVFNIGEIQDLEVSFSVEDQFGNSVDDAIITLGSVTNDPGDYEFIVNPGTYNYTVSKEGYSTAEGSVQVLNDDVSIDIVLEYFILDLPWTEDFTGVTVGEVPEFWARTHTNWGVSNTSNAGGEAPELRFNWTPSATDVFRAITPPLNALEADALKLAFNHMVNDWSGDYSLKVQASLDEGATWEDVWVLDIAKSEREEGASRETGGRNVPATLVILDLDDYAGEMFHLAFAFDGNSFNINQWYVDDIIVGDLDVFTLTMMEPDGHGTVTPDVGEYLYLEDTEVNISAVPGYAWVFDHWNVNGEFYSDEASTTITMDENKNVQAVFEVDEDAFVLTMLEPEGEGTVIPDVGINAYFEDDVVDLIADPAFGWLFSQWIGNVEDNEAAETTITMNQDEEVQAVFVAIPVYEVSGTVIGNDGPAVAGAMVTLTGYDNYTVETGADGSFVIEDVYEGIYAMTIVADGYDTYTDEIDVTDDLDLGTITLIESIIPPANLAVDVDGQEEGNALLTWSDLQEREFRWDDGTVIGQLGSTGGTLNTVLGSVHRNNAVLNEMSWYLTDNGGPHNFVKVWVFGLDASGQPNPNDVLYEMNNVPNVDLQWNTYEFSQPVEAPNGFLIGLSYQGFLAIARDTGIDPEWPFQPNTHFFVGDVTTGSFAAIETLGDFNENFLVRAFGVDNGELPLAKNAEIAEYTGKLLPSGSLLSEPVITGSPKYNSAGSSSANKAFEGYRVYLNGDLVDEDIFEFEYLFTDLDEGDYTAGVQSVYTTGESEIITVDFVLVFSVPVTINVTTNSGDSPEGALVKLINQDHAEYHYEHTVGADGVAHFEHVRKGIYTLHVLHEDFHEYVVENIDIQEEFSYTAELVEIIHEPFGLLVETEGYDPGEALFSWNNVLGTTLFEDFEGGTMPDGWDQIITNTGTGGPIPATWTVNDYVSADFSPFGTYHAGLWWDYENQDEWLITPVISIGMDYELEFWSAVFLGSTNADHYYVKISTDGGDSWTELWDASAQTGGWNYYNTPFILDLSEYNGHDVHVAFNAVDGPTNDGLWYIWFIDNVAVGPEGSRNTIAMSEFKRISKTGNDTQAEGNPDMIARDGTTFTIPGAKAEKALLGFNVFLNDEMVAEEVTDTEFLFTELPEGEHTAGVQSLYTTGTSEIVTIDFFIEEGIAIDTYEVTFHVNLDLAIEFGLLEGFDPEGHHIMMTGEMFGWTEPDPANEDMVLEWLEADPMLFGITLHLEADTYQYKFFSDLLGAGWDGGEWPGDPNRVVEVTGDMTVLAHFGYTDDEVSLIDVEDISVSIYPNPVRNTLNITSDDDILNIRMVDMLGQTVYSNTVNDNQHQIQVSGFQTGVYFIQMTTSRGVVTHRVQVTR